MVGRFLSLLLVGALASGASAQEEPPDEFPIALEHLNEQRYEEAKALLLPLFAAHPRASVAFNLGFAMRHTGDLLGALEHYELAISGELGGLVPELRARAMQERDEVLALVARVELQSRTNENVTVHFDDREAQTLAPGAILEVRALEGEHRLQAQAEGFAPMEQLLELAAGDRLPVEVQLRLLEQPTDPAPEPERGPNVLAWTLGIVGALVVGGAIAAAVLLTRDSEPFPYTEDPVFRHTETLQPAPRASSAAFAF